MTAIVPAPAVSSALVGYGDIIATLEALPVMVRETRRRKGMSLRAAATELGVSNVTVLAWERDGMAGASLENVVRALRWVAT